MENIREEVVDIRSCIAYLMVKWKLLLLALILGALAGGALGFVKQKQAGQATQVSYEEKLDKLRNALEESEARYVEQAYSQYKNYGEKLSSWDRYLKNSAFQRLDPDHYVKKDIQYVVESDNSDVISSFSVSLLGAKEYERIARTMGGAVTADNAGELVSVSGVSQTDTANLAAAQAGEALPQEPVASDMSGYFRSIMDITIVSPEEETADAATKILEEILEERTRELKESGVDVTVEPIYSTVVANDSIWLLSAQQDALYPMQTLQTARSSFVKNSVDVLGDKEKAYFEGLRAEESQTGTSAAAPAGKKVNKKKFIAAGALGLFLLAFGVLLLMYIYSDKIRAEEQLRRGYGLPVLLRCLIGKGRMGIDPIRNRGLSILTGADAACEAADGAGKLAAELAHRITGNDGRSVFLAYDTDKRDVRTAVAALAESLADKGVPAMSGNPKSSDEAYQELLGSAAAVVVETMNESGAIALKDILGVCRRNSLPVLGCVTLTDISKY